MVASPGAQAVLGGSRGRRQVSWSSGPQPASSQPPARVLARTVSGLITPYDPSVLDKPCGRGSGLAKQPYTCGGQNKGPQKVPDLRMCYLHGERNFADVMKDLEMKRLSLVIQVSSAYLQASL